MDVTVSSFRAHIREWLDRAQGGEEVVVTERGVPVARIVGVGSSPVIERLTLEGVISAPVSPKRPRAKDKSRAPVRQPLADLVSEQRE